MSVAIDRRGLGRFALLALAVPVAGCVGEGVGYPVQSATPAEPGRYALPADVLFPFGSAVLRPEAYAALGDTLGRIRGAIQYPAILVQGFTDSIGSPASNRQLSVRRAEAVRQWLVGQGIPPQAVTVEGFGEDRPVAPNTLPNGADNPQGRARNRRVELLARPA